MTQQQIHKWSNYSIWTFHSLVCQVLCLPLTFAVSGTTTDLDRKKTCLNNSRVGQIFAFTGLGCIQKILNFKKLTQGHQGSWKGYSLEAKIILFLLLFQESNLLKGLGNNVERSFSLIGQGLYHQGDLTKIKIGSTYPLPTTF